MNLDAPESTDILERALLGSLMLVGNAALPKVTRTLRPEHFLRETHRVIYEAILGVAASGADPDLVLVDAELDATGQLARAGGLGYVASLVDNLPCCDNVIFYAKHVRDRAVLRKASRRRTTP